MATNETHSPDLKSWVESANQSDSSFPIQNLPFGVVRSKGSNEPFRCAVAIGEYALNLHAVKSNGLINNPALEACQAETLNDFMALGQEAWSSLRKDISALLAVGSSSENAARECLIALSDVEYALPATIGDYTDFYTSIHHATNIGRLFRPDNPLLPNYEWVPIGYHGRSSSIEVTGQEFRRPMGQLKAPDQDAPVLGACKRLDYELEVGVFVGPQNPLGEPVGIEDAESHIFGLCLLNDWSARDIQAWEYQPLGPFLAKNFASTVSPWIVTLEALEPFRAPFIRDDKYPQPLPYLGSVANSESGAVDMQLQVLIETEKMRSNGDAAQSLSSSNFTDSFWTMAQMLTHHTISGCNLKPGDFFGSGTMSGSAEGSQAALIEITRGGAEPVQLENGETRTFLEDGDRIIMRARCKREGWVGIGFGEVAGTVLPALQS